MMKLKKMMRFKVEKYGDGVFCWIGDYTTYAETKKDFIKQVFECIALNLGIDKKSLKRRCKK